MQQAKGPTVQVHYAGARKPPKSEQNWGNTIKVILVKANQRKNGDNVNPEARAVSIVQGHHTLALYAQLQTSDALEKAVGESDILRVE